MTQVAELRDAVCRLSAPDRAELAAFLLGTLDETHYWVDDEEVSRRRDELNSGLVKGLSLKEFKQGRDCGIRCVAVPEFPQEFDGRLSLIRP